MSKNRKKLQLRRIMKLTTFMIIVGLMQASAAGFAQKVSLNVNNMPLELVLQAMKEQTKYQFVYTEDIMAKARPVNIHVQNAELIDVLSIVFDAQPLEFSVESKTIIIKEKEPSFLDRVVSAFQSIDVRGIVVDGETGQALAGASVKVKGTNRATNTGNDGAFFLRGVDEDAVIVVSFIGYVNQELKVKRDLGEIRLVMASANLNEVTINKGYYTTISQLNTGNVATVKSTVFSNQPITNPLQALAGRVAGVQISETNGLPGSPVVVQIRGRNSLNTANQAANMPLYIVDGVPFPATAIEMTAGPASGGGTIGSPLNNIVPADIERIEILKDADATAIYGSRGSNGVILITTKKGSSGATSMTGSYNRGFASATRIPEVLNTDDFLKFRRIAFANTGVTPNAANAPELFTYDQNADFQWPKWIIGNTVHRNDASATLSGGNNKNSFLLSGNYHHENSLRSESDAFRRAGFHLNANHESQTGKFSLITDIFYNSSYTNLKSGGISLVSVYGGFPNYPIYTSTGEYNWATVSNNYAAQAQAYYKTNTDNLNSNVRLSYKIRKDLQITVNTGLNKISADQMSVTPGVAISPSLSASISPNTIFSKQFTRSLITEPMLTFSPIVGQHKIDVLVGGTYQNNKTRGNSYTITGYSNVNQQESTNFGTVSQKSDNIVDYKYLSTFGRLGYHWKSKYIFNGTYRRDGSSRFGPGRQFVNFASIGAAWIFSKEPVIEKNLSWLSLGKLRGSFGSTGSDGIPDYGFLSLFNTGPQYGNMNSLVPTQIANEDYRWEINKKFEVAVELGAFKNRILFNTAFYRNRSDNQLVGYPLPSTTGFGSYQANLPALVENKGWEFELQTTNIEKKHFTWTTNANLTISTNRLLKFTGIEKTSYANSYVVGQSLAIVQGYKLIRVNPADGLPEFEDQNKDGLLTNRSSYNQQGGDFMIIGQTNPKWFAGIDNNLTFGNFSVNIFLQYTRQQGYNYIKQMAGFGRLNPFRELSNYWKQAGDETSIPKPFSGSNIGLINYNLSSPTFGDASFLRLKNVNLNYTLPSFITNWGLKSCRIYVQGQNLLTVTKYKVLDPEQAGDSNSRVPPLRVITFGLQVTL